MLLPSHTLHPASLSVSAHFPEPPASPALLVEHVGSSSPNLCLHLHLQPRFPSLDTLVPNTPGSSLTLLSRTLSILHPPLPQTP